jgi:Ribosomal L30 N-terminal domain
VRRPRDALRACEHAAGRSKAPRHFFLTTHSFLTVCPRSKKRLRDEAWAAKRASTALEARKKAREQRREIFKRAESYVKEYRQQVRPRGAEDQGARGG